MVQRINYRNNFLPSFPWFFKWFLHVRLCKEKFIYFPVYFRCLSLCYCFVDWSFSSSALCCILLSPTIHHPPHKLLFSFGSVLELVGLGFRSGSRLPIRGVTTVVPALLWAHYASAGADVKLSFLPRTAMHIEMYLSVFYISFYLCQRSLLRQVPFSPAKFDQFRGVQTLFKVVRTWPSAAIFERLWIRILVLQISWTEWGFLWFSPLLSIKCRDNIF
jgi:hypothetical protein